MLHPIMQVNFYVRDIESSVRFYRDVLGFHFQGFWDPVSKTAAQEWRGHGKPEYGELRVGAARIGLFAAPDASHPSGRVEMAVHVDDVRQDHARIKAAGAAPTELSRQAWGASTFFVTDPDGFKWQLVETTNPC
jgi:catechol 2,3-dioxygenase-like lactoylglutathione lyase family enzyme